MAFFTGLSGEWEWRNGMGKRKRGDRGKRIK